MIQRMGGKSATMLSDSRLVVGQVKGELEARNERMQGYLAQIRHLQLKFESFSLQHILRSGNTKADSLATLATSMAQDLPRVILIEDLCKPSGIRGNMTCVHHVRIGPSQMDPIIIAVIKLTKSQFFNPSSTNLLTRVHWAEIQYYLGLSQEIVTLHQSIIFLSFTLTLCQKYVVK